MNAGATYDATVFPLNVNDLRSVSSSGALRPGCENVARMVARIDRRTDSKVRPVFAFVGVRSVSILSRSDRRVNVVLEVL